MAVATLAASLLLTGCGLVAPSPQELVTATAFVPFALVAYAVAAAAWGTVRRLGRGRRPVSTVALALCVLGLLVQVALLVPSYAGTHASGKADVTVLTANLRLGHAHPAALLRLLDDQHADVVVLEEVTPEIYTALARGEHGYSYSAGRPAPGAFGTIVLSRYPLQQVTQLPVSKGAWQMRVAASTPFELVGLHTTQPLISYDEWRADHDALRAAVAAIHGPLVVAGDFNATLDHRPMRQLLGDGLSDAARQANSGWQPTWPGAADAAGSLPFQLGVMALDHVLVSEQFSAISTRTFLVPGSDHRALLARLALRRPARGR